MAVCVARRPFRDPTTGEQVMLTERLIEIEQQVLRGGQIERLEAEPIRVNCPPGLAEKWIDHAIGVGILIGISAKGNRGTIRTSLAWRVMAEPKPSVVCLDDYDSSIPNARYVGRP